MTIPTPGTTFEPVELPSKYFKTFVAIALAILLALQATLSDGRVSLVEAQAVSVVTLDSILVYLIPNLASGVARYAKLIIAVLGSLVVAGIFTVFSDGVLSASEAVLLLIAVMRAVGVGVAPNTGYVAKHKFTLAA